MEIQQSRQKRILAQLATMSALCPKQTSAASFDDLAGTQ
jgi:hypothetical protein